MILGVDHLALNVIDTDKANDDLISQDFQCVFIERDVPNNIAKIPLLKTYQAKHDLGVFRPKGGGVPVEITNHGPSFPGTEGPFSYKGGYIELRTPNVNKEKEFWLGEMGFMLGDDNSMQLRRPVPNWSCTLQLIEDSTIMPYTLDSMGYTCLAFTARNINDLLVRIVSGGGKDATRVFESKVNGREMDIAMFRTPAGAICELIEIR